MKRNLFTSFMLALCLGLSALVLTACGKTDYDMSGVAFNDITKDYTESTVILTETDLEGTLPEGVEVSFEYFSDEERTQPIIAKDAGIYYVTAKFTGDDKHNPIQDKYATLTINKVNFSNVTFDIAGTYTDSTNNKVTVVAKSENENSVYFEYDAKQFKLSIQNESIDNERNNCCPPFDSGVERFKSKKRMINPGPCYYDPDIFSIERKYERSNKVKKKI